MLFRSEDNRELIISWCEKGYFKSYYVVPLSQKMGARPARVEEVINILREIDVDGETMQYILEKVGMEDQMLRQLMFSAHRGYVEDLWEEIIELEKSHD